jgi:cell wall-associated NlpC family hydrolase
VSALGALTSSLILGTASPAEATTLKQRALAIAAEQKGKPYRYGAAGPDAFDCSGLTSYSYLKAGEKIPRTAQTQYNASRHISPSSRQPGDLVFIGKTSSGIYHVGIYAGNSGGYGWMWDAPKPGRTVGKHKIRDYVYGAPRAFYGEVK